MLAHDMHSVRAPFLFNRDFVIRVCTNTQRKHILLFYWCCPSCIIRQLEYLIAKFEIDINAKIIDETHKKKAM